MLLPKLSESLAGRMELLTLWPFSQGEMKGVWEGFIDGLFSKQSVWPSESQLRRDERVGKVHGGYPSVIAGSSSARRKARDFTGLSLRFNWRNNDPQRD